METAPCPKIVLIVEDDLDIRETFRQLLELEGYCVLTASNGKEGLEVLQGPQRPSMVLLDLMMPVMNGWEFLEAQRALPEYSKIPVVVVTAAGKDKEKTVGAAGFIKKPIELDVLLSVVKRYC
ncbi:MAG: response regulator [Oligoflexia bacterium]|nr:response regulator [Oligoflexia bacterium]